MSDTPQTDGDKLIPEWSLDGDRQIVVVGLAVLALFLGVLGVNAFTGDDDGDSGDAVAAAVERSTGGGSGEDDPIVAPVPETTDTPATTAATTTPTTEAPTTTAPTTTAPTTTAPTTEAPASTAPATSETIVDPVPEVQAVIDADEFAAAASGAAGVVTLTGIVPTVADAERLVTDAAAVDGVVEVIDELAVLEADVAGAASSFDGVDGTVDGYTAVLTGIHTNADDQRSLAATVADLAGVAALDDRTTISTGNADTATATDDLEAQLNELVQLAPVQFQSGSDALLPASINILDTAADILSGSDVAVTIEGHTDSQGDADSNLALSQARAETVVDYLVSRGIDADRLTATGFGEERLLNDPDDTPEKRFENRRIEFRIG